MAKAPVQDCQDYSRSHWRNNVPDPTAFINSTRQNSVGLLDTA